MAAERQGIGIVRARWRPSAAVAMGVLLGLGPLARSAEAADASAAGASDTAALSGGAEPDASSEAAHEAGMRAYDSGDFLGAAEHFRRAYELHGAQVDLYGWAQAARSAGDCRAAVELYRRFIELGVEGDARVAAERNEARCQEQLEQAPPPKPEAGPSSIVTPPAPRIDHVPAPERPRRRPPADPVGLGLVIGGGIASIAGATVLGIAGAQQAAQAEAVGYRRFDSLDARIDRLYLAGGITLGVGIVLTVVGTVRLVVKGNRARQPTVAWRNSGH